MRSSQGVFAYTVCVAATVGSEAHMPMFSAARHSGGRPSDHAVIAPTITAVTPRVTPPGSLVKIAGTDLLPTGYTVELEYTRKYHNPITQSALARIPVGGTSTLLQFGAPVDMRADGLVLRYTLTAATKGQPATMAIPVPGTVAVVQPPSLFPLAQTITVSGQARPRFSTGSLTIMGRHLVTSVASGPSNAAIPTISPTRVTFLGSTLQITQTAYDPSVTMPDGIRGVDILTVTVPDVGFSGLSGDVSVTAHAGSASLTGAVYIEPPRITRLVEIIGTTIRTLSGQSLFRGREYRLEGESFNTIVSGITLETGTVTVAGTAQQAQPDGSNATRFALQTPSTSGGIAISTLGGAATFGSFQIVDAPTTLPIADVVVVPNDAIGGTRLTATVSFAGSLPAGVTPGNLVVEGAGDAFALPTSFSISSNPKTVEIETGGLQSDVTRPLTFRVVPSSGGVDSVVRTVTLRRLEPVAVTVTPPTILGGQNAVARIDFNVPAGYPGTLLGGKSSIGCGFPGNTQVKGSLTSSDTTAATVSTALCVDEATETKSVTTRTVTAPKTVTIAATVNGVTRSASLTVLPGQLASVSVSRPTMVSMQSATATVTVTSPLPGAAAFLASSDPAVAIPAKITLGSGLTSTFPITTAPVGEARTVTITALVNGVTQTATVVLQPLQITGVTFAPATVAAGSNTLGTVRLNAKIDLPITVTLASGDVAVATVPGIVSFAGNQDTAIFNVQTVGPQSQSKSVTVSASYSITPPGGVAVSTTQTGTLTVTP